MKDLTRPETVFQLFHPDLASDFPPLKSLNSTGLPNNLPLQLTTFVGREKEMAEITGLLTEARLLTLTGSGGCGKTRLSLQVAADLSEQYPDGVWLVELAPVGDSELVSQTVAEVLSVREQSGRSLQQTLIDVLKGKRLLLLLDNCEHLLTACAQLAAALLGTCPGVKILASSREGLRIAGEQTYRVPGMSLPLESQKHTADSISEYEAARLFIERAQSVKSDFHITDSSARSLVSICSRLDGIPLAIELAAARARSLTVEQINDRLDDQFKLLTGGSRTALPRQQTLRALIDWSFDLLEPREQIVLMRLSVFSGGWTLGAAEAVCADDGGDVSGGRDGIEGNVEVEMHSQFPVPSEDILDLLTSLADKSLVIADAEGESTRYRLLETVRQYARDRPHRIRRHSHVPHATSGLLSDVGRGDRS